MCICIHGKTPYTVNYLPPNYYKVWSPLWNLLEKKQLPYQARVLELGASPGTSGLALLDFYGKLAAANPGLDFSVAYTAVERETAFRRIFDNLLKTMIEVLPKTSMSAVKLFMRTRLTS